MWVAWKANMENPRVLQSFTIFVSFPIRFKASLSNHQYNYVYAVGPFGSLLNYS